jgi:purine-binding chemotaxis protein CheW
MEQVGEPCVQTVYLSFYIAGEEYAIPVERVREVVEFDSLTRIPGMPPCIRGLMNLRGSVVPVVDLGLKFGFSPSDLTKWTCIVVVEVDLDGESTVMGVIADAVSQVVDLSSDQIEPPPTFGTRIRVDYLLGMGRLGKKFVLILDIDRVLSIDELLAVCSLRSGVSDLVDGSPRGGGSSRTSSRLGGEELNS